MTAIERAIALVEELNDAWREERFDDLSKYFHEDAVMMVSPPETPVVGVAPMVQSYRDFANIGKIHAFEVTGIEAFPFDDLVMCHLHFDVDFEIAEGRFQESGVEVYVVSLAGDDPKVLWRAQIPRRDDDE